MDSFRSFGPLRVDLSSKFLGIQAGKFTSRANRTLYNNRLIRKQNICFGLVALVLLSAGSTFAQREGGAIRLKVRDIKGDPLIASVALVSELNHVQRAFKTNRHGNFVASQLPFGLYRLEVTHPGFVPYSRLIQVRSEVPLTVLVKLGLAPVRSSINVTDSSTLIDPERSRAVYSVGRQALDEQIPAQLGRGVTNAVNSEPGWLYEANGVLHPRGSEYDVQFVVNGLPLTENRSAALSPPIPSANVQSMRVMTAGFPAEYGRKLGGVVEVSTVKDLPAGFHMSTLAQGGSFATACGGVEMGYARSANQFMLSGSGGVTNRYLDPPVLANYTNRGSSGSSSGMWSRDLTQRDHIQISVHRAQVRYAVPNERIQQEAGQFQSAADFDTSVEGSYDHVLSSDLLFSAQGSFRDETFRLWSNRFSTPIVISEQRGFHQGYARVTLAGTKGIHDWKIGADALFGPVHENLQYSIANLSLFDPGTDPRFELSGKGTDAEPAVYVQDSMHFRNWNLNLGLRYDRYQFVVNQSAWSPRVAVSRYFNKYSLLVHADYDRVFQTPAMENLLLASSPAIDQISPLVLRLPVEPARANYYEVGLTKGVRGHIRLDVNVFLRTFRNFADDDTLLNTGVSFPIADARARIHGVEGKLAMPDWGRFSSSISYSYQEAVGQGPITGGLFIGSEAISEISDNSRFWVSQDQRNTARASLRYQVTHRLWLSTENSFGSGLPVELDTGNTNYNFLLAQYGSQILGKVDFARGRVRPSYSLDAGAGFDLYKREGKNVSLQVQGSNLIDRLNVINFASLFSGTAISTPRSFGLRVKASF